MGKRRTFDLSMPEGREQWAYSSPTFAGVRRVGNEDSFGFSPRTLDEARAWCSNVLAKREAHSNAKPLTVRTISSASAHTVTAPMVALTLAEITGLSATRTEFGGVLAGTCFPTGATKTKEFGRQISN